MGREEFYQALSISAEKIRTEINDEKDISIIAKASADGIVSAGILTNVLYDLGSKCSIRFVPELTLDVILRIKSESHDLLYFLDLGTGFSKHLRNSYGNDWLVIDNNTLPREEIITDDEGCILNPWKFDIDGEREISSGGVSYLLVKRLEKKFKFMSYLPVVSALAENQDQGEKRSFVGPNADICDESIALGLVEKEMDILLSRKDSGPLHLSLAQTIYPYVHGLTWNEKNCLKIITSAGVETKNGGRWRSLSELSQDEKFLIIETVTKYVNSHSKVQSHNLENLLAGYSYILTNEERGTILREARDYSFLLNCCCIQSKPSIGLAISIGNRTTFLSEAGQCVKYLEDNIRDVILKIMSEKWRIRDIGTTIWINLDTITRDCNLHLLSSLLSGYSEFQGKIIILRTETVDSHYIYLIREIPGLQSSSGIGTHAHRLANELGGSSNRSDSFVECVISSSTVDNFDSRLKKVIDYSRGD